MPLGTGDVEDDLWRLFFDGAVRVEELARDVGEDAGAFDGDFLLDEKEAREKGVDLARIGKVVSVAAVSMGSGRGVRVCSECLGQKGWSAKPRRRQRIPLGKR